jgi:aspartyl-tRNA(Asn)/glutamyl-tRNA(Gln) amidotransferase subunit A
MTGDELAASTATSLIDLYRSGTVSPVEVVRACIDRIEATDLRIGAVITLLAEEALVGARDSERRYAAGTARPLEGVPYGLKDIIATAGIRTTGASRFYEEFVPDYSASVYERLDAAGAVLVAKLNTFPFALGSERGDVFGPVRNPWDPTRTPGGSSAGSAAALACGQLPLAVGTDTGGSIRLPATWCGVSGLKTTSGRVPVTGVMPLAWSLDTVGPMARCAEDLALALGVMAGPDGVDRTALPAAVPDYVAELTKGVAGLRVAMPRSWFLERCDPEVVAGTEQTAEILTSLGAVISDVSLPNVGQSMAVGWTILLAELGSLHEVHAEQLDRFDPTFAQYVRQSDFVSAHDYLKCLRTRTLIQQDFRSAMTEVDAVLVPGNVASAPKLDDMLLDIGDEHVPWLELAARHTFVFNITGMPSVVVPSGLNRFGLPIGVQIAAAPFREDICLRLAHALQQATDHHRLRPPRFELAA